MNREAVQSPTDQVTLDTQVDNSAQLTKARRRRQNRISPVWKVLTALTLAILFYIGVSFAAVLNPVPGAAVSDAREGTVAELGAPSTTR